MLVDRLWPRGLAKEDARLDWWAKELAPSDKLRRWFGHAPPRYREFVARYRAELEGNELMGRLRILAAERPVTLLYAARAERPNTARALVEILAGGSATPSP